jgi:hypothetical protein
MTSHLTQNFSDLQQPPYIRYDSGPTDGSRFTAPRNIVKRTNASRACSPACCWGKKYYSKYLYTTRVVDAETDYHRIISLRHRTKALENTIANDLGLLRDGEKSQ